MKNLALIFLFAISGTLLAQNDSTVTSDTAARPLTFVKDMPHFLECEDTANSMAENMCTRELFGKYIIQHFIYPDEAREKNIQGTVYVQFIVSTAGFVTKVKVIRGVHPLIDDAAVQAVSQIPSMIPGSQLGVFVPVIYTVPVKVMLSGEQKKKKRRLFSR